MELIRNVRPLHQLQIVCTNIESNRHNDHQRLLLFLEYHLQSLQNLYMRAFSTLFFDLLLHSPSGRCTHYKTQNSAYKHHKRLHSKQYLNLYLCVDTILEIRIPSWPLLANQLLATCLKLASRECCILRAPLATTTTWSSLYLRTCSRVGAASLPSQQLYNFSTTVIQPQRPPTQ